MKQKPPTHWLVLGALVVGLLAGVVGMALLYRSTLPTVVSPSATTGSPLPSASLPLNKVQQLLFPQGCEGAIDCSRGFNPVCVRGKWLCEPVNASVAPIKAVTPSPMTTFSIFAPDCEGIDIDCARGSTPVCRDGRMTCVRDSAPAGDEYGYCTETDPPTCYGNTPQCHRGSVVAELECNQSGDYHCKWKCT